MRSSQDQYWRRLSSKTLSTVASRDWICDVAFARVKGGDLKRDNMRRLLRVKCASLSNLALVTTLQNKRMNEKEAGVVVSHDEFFVLVPSFLNFRVLVPSFLNLVVLVPSFLNF